MSSKDKAAREAAVVAKALADEQARLEAEAANAERLSNHEAAKQAVMARVEIFGRQHGRGEGGLTNAAFMFAGAVAAGLLAEENAKDVYLTFVRGHNSVARPNSGAGVAFMADDDEGAKVPISIFRTFGKAAPVAQGLGLYDRVLHEVATIAKDDRVGSSYNCFVKVNRELVKLAEKTVDNGATLKVDDETLRAWCTKPARPEKDDAAKLHAAVELIRKLAASGKYVGLDDHHARLASYEARFIAGTHAAPISTLVQMGGTDDGSSTPDADEKIAA